MSAERLSGRYSKVTKSAANYILKHHSTIESVKDVAKGIGHNYNTLRVRFRRETGVTLMTYLTRTRLYKARKLLLDPKIQVKDVAWKVGYNNESHFTHSFREEFGELPSIYRSVQLSKSLAILSEGLFK